MASQYSDVYEFGPYRLDTREHLLSRDGATVSLEPTQLQVLAMLVREAGHLLTREELIEAVWKDTYVDEGSLTVTISTLRRKLGDTPSEPKYIATIRKSGYRFVAPVSRRLEAAPVLGIVEPGLSQVPSAVATRPHRIGIPVRLGFAAALVLVVALGWYSPRSGVMRDATLAPVLLHPFGGIQEDGSFSPNGAQIAFTWRPSQSDNHDVYILRIGDLEATRLTSHPAVDTSPAWSPDGRRIAFIRRNDSGGEILLISPAGGPEEKVVETKGTSVVWSADSKTLAFIDRAAGEERHSIFLVPAAGGKERQVTFSAAEKTYGDSSPAISPDGRTLAFVRHLTYDVADIFVQPLEAGTARQLTFDKRQIRGVTWMPDGEELIFSSNRSGRHQLWRVKVSREAEPTLVTGIIDARVPAISSARARSGSRLVYQALTEDYSIRLLKLRANRAWDTSRLSFFAASVRDEQNPRVSPDGHRLAFVSDRSGWFEVWVCAYPEGSRCRQLTSFRQGYVGSPSWSPDSQRIVFDARVDGNADIYLVRADGGQPVRLTHDTSVEARASWSGDGRWLYFRSDRTGAHQIWKMPVAGGTPIQVTRNGGFDALESPDGTLLYYVQERYRHGLWSVPVGGGPETRVPRTGTVTASSWAIIDEGILWIDVTVSNPPAAIRYYDFATREVSKVAEVSGYVIPSATGFFAVRDGTALVWSELDRNAHDLMLVEGFR